MFIAIAILILVAVLAIHEFSHAVAMRHYGVPVKQAGLGFPVPPMITLSVPRISFPITVSWFLLGAYVSPTPEGEELMKKLPYREQAVIFGAGVVANLVTAAVIYVVLVLFVSDYSLTEQLVRAGLVAAVVILGIRFISFFCSFAIIPLGLAMFAAVAFIVVKAVLVDPVEAVASGADGNIAGPVGIVKMTFAIKDFWDVMIWGYIISMALGTTNMLPLSILDGGRIFQAALKEYVSEKAAVASMAISSVMFVALILFVFAGDFMQG